MVRVFTDNTTNGNQGILLANGIVVGDGSQVLTVLNYSNYNPDSPITVESASGQTYKAAVIRLDPRTSTTLLSLNNAILKPAALGDTKKIKENTKALLQGWEDTGAVLSFSQLQVLYSGHDDTSDTPFFNIGFTGKELMYSGNYPPGTTITDNKGKVLGLIEAAYSEIMPHPHTTGFPPVIDISNALSLLNPETDNQEWMKGPAFAQVVTSFSMISVPFSRYNDVTSLLNDILGTAANPLPYVPAVLGAPREGICLIAIYPRPVDIENTSGEKAATAKWVCLELNRGAGKPDQLYFGTVPYEVQGGFILNGDTTELGKLLISNW